VLELDSQLTYGRPEPLILILVSPYTSSTKSGSCLNSWFIVASDSKLLDFELLDYSNRFFQRLGLPGGLDFIQKFHPKISRHTMGAALVGGPKVIPLSGFLSNTKEGIFLCNPIASLNLFSFGLCYQFFLVQKRNTLSGFHYTDILHLGQYLRI
jgi:hypothetical protein